MKISSLLIPILKSIRPMVKYELILRKDFIIHFYTVQNSKCRYDGIETIIGSYGRDTKESTLDFLDPHMEEYDVREFVVIFDDVRKTFTWNPVRTNLPHGHPHQLGPVYEWIEV